MSEFELKMFDPATAEAEIAKLKAESPRTLELLETAVRALGDERYPETFKASIVAACVWGAYVIGKQVSRGEPG